MNCESKICMLENVQTVNSVYVISRDARYLSDK